MRGSEKRIIYIKDTGSKLFAEAYFILRRGAAEEAEGPAPDDMVREAERLLTEGSGRYPAAVRRARRRRMLTAFLSGAAAAMSFLGALSWLIL